MNLVLSLVDDGPQLHLPHEPLSQPPAAIGRHHRDVHTVHARRVHHGRGKPHDVSILRRDLLLLLVRIVVVLVEEQEPGDRRFVVGEGDAVEELVVDLIVAFRAFLRKAQRVRTTHARGVRTHPLVVAPTDTHRIVLDYATGSSRKFGCDVRRHGAGATMSRLDAC